MRILFMGTDEFAVPSLRRLLHLGEDVLGVVTQQDKPRGRGLKVQPSPVKAQALQEGLPVYQPEKLRDPAFIGELERLSPDLIVVCAFAKLIPPSVFRLPPLGTVNVHPSLLPDYRGATPVEAAVMDGREETGVTTFYIDKGYDTGDLILQRSYPISGNDTGGSLRAKLSEFAAGVLEETVTLLREGKAPRIPQDQQAGSYTPMFAKEDLLLDWSREAAWLRNRIRALAPAPSSRTTFRGTLLKVKTAEVVAAGGPPGTILELREKEGPVVAAGSGALLLREVQPASRNPMSGWDFVLGYRPRAGEILGEPSRVGSET